MNHILIFALAAAFGAVAGGCDRRIIPTDRPVILDRDGGSGTDACSDDLDCPFGQECVDGLCTAVEAIAGDGGCRSDADCEIGARCALSTGRCVPVATAPPPLPGPPGPCVGEETRTCGEKIGACEYGIERCVDGAWSGICEGGQGPSAELCDRIDNDCDGEADEGFVVGLSCSAGLGVCAQRGFLQCTADGAGTECSAAPLPSEGRVELCGNGTDDDCDGVADDRLEFPNLGQSCDVGVGACRRTGAFVCTGDGLGTVCSAVPGAPAAAELCGNSIDDNCDGRVDEGFEALGAACTIPGVCPVPGTLRCSADRVGLECVPDVPIGPETLCNGIDDDLDSCPDDGFPVGALCAVGTGACRRTGTLVCNDTEDGTVCAAVPGTPGTELCGNNIDEDCDGQLNNGFNLGAPCTVGVGACQRSGVLVCGPGGTSAVCSATPGAPSAEQCGNNIDENCNGVLDDGFDIGAPCTAGDGICQRSGVKICNAANPLTTVCNAVPGAPNPLGELCGNGLDDDCDRSVDEGFPNLGAVCAQGTGECRRNGTFVCSADRTTTVCNAVPGTPVAEICDNRDNDCNTVIDNGCDDDGDGYCDATLGFAPPPGGVTVCPRSTNASLLDCNDTNAAIHPGAIETCRIDAIDMNCDGDPNDGCPPCDPNIDNDFDGSNQCEDCDDTNGAVRPGAVERCDGIDNDCDGLIDEDFDRDGDGFTTCGTIPGGGLDRARVDCNDTPGAGAHIHPGACELCANASGTVACGQPNDRGNGVDENCNGFVDETCRPCSTADADGDGATQCDGDCNDNDPAVRPGRAEICDGKDTDCNRTTVENCDVGDQCDDIIGADTFDETADRCKENLVCVTPVNGQGNPTGNPTCTSFCNFSFAGLGLGDGCDSDEICSAFLSPTANLHGCSVASGFGTRASGQACSRDSDCRSGNCFRDGRFAPPQNYCSDLCGSDSYCGAGTTCQVSGIDSGRCLRPLSTQTRDTGTLCTGATDNFRCLHGERSCIDMNGTKRCSEPCCTNSDCPSAHYCSLNGLDSAAPGGGFNTVPMCFPETSGNGGRQAGAACTSNAQCASEFCDRNLNVCVDVCCNDSTCPIGLECEDAIVRRTGNKQSFGRFCLSATPSAPLEKR
jgi:hypothetical protein